MTGGISVGLMKEGFVMANLVTSISSKANMRLATVGSKRGRTIPLTHHIFTDNGWREAPSDPHPSMQMNVSACPEDHAQFGHPIHQHSSPKSSSQIVVCDTGCMSTAVPPAAAYKVGLKKRDFIPVAVVMKFQLKSGNKLLSTKQLCYVCTKVDRIYLNCAGLKQLGIVAKEFPHTVSSQISAVTEVNPTTTNHFVSKSCGRTRGKNEIISP